MTKKDYEAFASVICGMNWTNNEAGLEETIDLCVRVFQIDNPSFKEEKFRTACMEGKHIRKSIKERF